MSVLAMLSLALAAITVVWALDTFVLQAGRYRRLVAQVAQLDAAAIPGAIAELTDSPVARLMAQAAGLAVLFFLVAVVGFRLDVDFALVLVLTSALSGLFWLLDVVYLRRLRQDALASFARGLEARGISSDLPQRLPLLVEYSESFFPVLLAVLVVRSFLAEPFTIPSGSMLPTLEVGDYILVNKFAYGLRVPVLGTKFVSIGEPQRGDIIVFRYPKDPTQNFIKRLVGLPGDHIMVDGAKLYVNGKLVDATFDHQNPDQDPWEQYFREQLGQHQHLKRQLVGDDSNASGMKFTDVVVPAGHYFMMGDNRDESDDSRYWGFVPDKNIVGKAFCIWVHKQPGGHLPSFDRDGIVN